MYRNGRDISDGFHSPDRPEKIVLGVDLIGVLGKISKEVEFLGGKYLLFAIHKYPAGGLIDLDAVDLYDVIVILFAAGTDKSFVLRKPETVAPEEYGVILGENGFVT